MILDINLSSDDYPASNELQSLSTVPIRLNPKVTIDALVGDVSQFGGGKLSRTLIPSVQPLTVVNSNRRMTKCKFALINFPNLWGQDDIHRPKDPKNPTGASIVTQRLLLASNPWAVEISGHGSLMSLDFRMKREGGSAVTHAGSITRIDGGDFSLESLEHFIRALHLFLSFVRGSYCGIAFLSGRDSSGELAWQQWGTYKMEPWLRDLPTWTVFNKSEQLSSTFDGFWDNFNIKRWSDAVSKSIHWYLRSNESDESEVSIVLSQTAIERLCSTTIGPKKSGEKTGDWIARALKCMDIDHRIPLQCGELTRIAGQCGWQHGPHSLVGIRNDLVHPEAKLSGAISGDVYSEARDLSQYYIELMLLKLFRHKGQFFNRLKHRQGYASAVESVPWSVTP